MQLVFTKSEDGNVSVEIKEGVASIPFDYVEMIKKLLDNNEIEITVFEGDISEEEQSKINDMLQQISESIPAEEVITDET